MDQVGKTIQPQIEKISISRDGIWSNEICPIPSVNVLDNFVKTEDMEKKEQSVTTALLAIIEQLKLTNSINQNTQNLQNTQIKQLFKRTRRLRNDESFIYEDLSRRHHKLDNATTELERHITNIFDNLNDIFNELNAIKAYYKLPWWKRIFRRPVKL